MSIKTWRQRSNERGIGAYEAQVEEINELRAALAERDAEVGWLKPANVDNVNWFEALKTDYDKQRKVLGQALEALNTIISVTGSAYTPQQKRGMVDAAITAIQEQLKS